MRSILTSFFQKNRKFFRLHDPRNGIAHPFLFPTQSIASAVYHKKDFILFPKTSPARKTEQMAESGPIFNFFHIVSLSDFSLIPASLVTEKSEYK